MADEVPGKTILQLDPLTGTINKPQTFLEVHVEGEANSQKVPLSDVIGEPPEGGALTSANVIPDMEPAPGEGPFVPPVTDSLSGVAVGSGASATGVLAVAVGFMAQASGPGGAVAVGILAKSSGVSTVAVGNNSVASGDTATALGTGANATGVNSLSAGTSATASGESSVAVGNAAVASATGSMAIGRTSEASADDGLALGNFSRASHVSSVALGTNSRTDEDLQVSLGKAAEGENAELTRRLSHMSEPEQDTDGATKKYIDTHEKLMKLFLYATEVANWNFDPPTVDPDSIYLDARHGVSSSTLYAGQNVYLVVDLTQSSGPTGSESKGQVDWGDGSAIQEFFWDGSRPSHNYDVSAAGDRTVRVRAQNAFGWGEWADASTPSTIVVGVQIPSASWTFSLEGGATLTPDGTLDTVLLMNGNPNTGNVLAIDQAGYLVVDFGQRVDLLEMFLGRRFNDAFGTFPFAAYYVDAQVEDYNNPGSWLNCNWTFTGGPSPQPPFPGQIAQVIPQSNSQFRLSQRMRIPLPAGSCINSITFNGYEAPGV